MRKNKIRILHVAQAAGGVDRYIRMLLKYLDKEKFENILICSQDFHEEDYKGLVDYFDQVEMTRAIGSNDLKAIKSVRTLIKKYNPDIVYAHSSKAGAIARVADIGLKNHCVYNPHGWAFNMRCSAKKKAVYSGRIAAIVCWHLLRFWTRIKTSSGWQIFSRNALFASRNPSPLWILRVKPWHSPLEKKQRSMCRLWTDYR